MTDYTDQLAAALARLADECETNADFGDVQGRGHQSELDALDAANEALAAYEAAKQADERLAERMAAGLPIFDHNTDPPKPAPAIQAGDRVRVVEPADSFDDYEAGDTAYVYASDEQGVFVYWDRRRFADDKKERDRCDYLYVCEVERVD